MMTKANRLLNRYIVSGSCDKPLVPSGYKQLQFLFDTGATVSIISPDIIFSKDIFDSGRSTIDSVVLDSSKSGIVPFDDKDRLIPTYIGCLENVKIGELYFDKFYTCIMKEYKNSVCVLGFDFIDNCTLSHTPGGSIDILNFDYDKYYKYWDKRISEEGVITRDDFVFSMQQESSYAGYHVRDSVIYTNEDFDAIIPERLAVVKEVFIDHMIITELDTNTDLWIQEGLNLDQVKRRKVTGASALRGK